jgi:hypothetical protein
MRLVMEIAVIGGCAFTDQDPRVAAGRVTLRYQSTPIGDISLSDVRTPAGYGSQAHDTHGINGLVLSTGIG